MMLNLARIFRQAAKKNITLADKVNKHVVLLLHTHTHLHGKTSVFADEERAIPIEVKKNLHGKTFGGLPFHFGSRYYSNALPLTRQWLNTNKRELERSFLRAYVIPQRKPKPRRPTKVPPADGPYIQRGLKSIKEEERVRNRVILFYQTNTTDKL